ncbi:dipeptide epimerase [Halalkalicoccus subterraneus]|uniref:dipeptide epimerase n=1 Tax=Halalkalicoccus subterraneus TaxID=2675002 RepID=UPI000EFBE356|nr:dipeptide epimerase [Halalkalicoccus subterraneus]
MSLETGFERVILPLEFPFTISRGTTEETENVIVRVSDGRDEGIGGAAPSAHYGETVDTVEAVLPTLLETVEGVGDPHQLERIERRMRERVNLNPAARCAVSIALHDLVAKRLGLPLYRCWGLDPEDLPETSYTIGIDDVESMRGKTATACERGYSTLKVKLGTERDEEIIETVRDEAPEATIRVDANEAWSPREAVRKIEALAEFGVEFVEQPVPAENPEGMAFVRERSALPIAADESCVTLSDIPQVAEIADIANVKLMKCGSLREARAMFAAARAHGLETMLGCMTESNASIAAACHLAPLLDYADLDGSLLLADDPYEGVSLPEGGIDLASVERGTGASVR